MALQPVSHPAPPSLDIAYINLHRRTDRRAFMSSMLASSLAAAAKGDDACAARAPQTRPGAGLGRPCSTLDSRAGCRAACVLTRHAPVETVALEHLRASSEPVLEVA